MHITYGSRPQAHVGPGARARVGGFPLVSMLRRAGAALVLSAASLVATGIAGPGSPAIAAAGPCGPASLMAVSTTNNNLFRWTAQNAATPSWSGSSQVGSNWSGIRLMAAEDGWASQSWPGSAAAKLYAIDTAGNLKLYTFNGSTYTGGSVIGTGFASTTRLLAAGGGVLYTVRSDGGLYWNRYLGNPITAGYQRIGTSWGQFTRVISGGNGIIYAVRPNGELAWYRHQTPAYPEGNWLGPRTVGNGWNSLRDIVSAGDGILYGINSSQQLVKYNHLGAQTGAVSWLNGGNPTVIGQGWGSYNRLTVNPRACANPTPARQDSLDRTVYFVHGIDALIAPAGAPGADCGQTGGGTWGSAIPRFRALGYSGPLRTVAYYYGDTDCSTFISDVTRVDQHASISSIGFRFAWFIYENHSQFGEPIDVVAHSMGGLITRVALDYTQRGVRVSSQAPPPMLLVEDVTTLATPHLGSPLSAPACAAWSQQCRDMIPGSSFLQSLTGVNPQSAMGTDWTLIGSISDEHVPWPSALARYEQGLPGAMSPGHVVGYLSGGLKHSDVTKGTGSCCFEVQHWDYHGRSLFPDDAPATGSVLFPAAKVSFMPGIPIDWAYNSTRLWSEW